MIDRSAGAIKLTPMGQGKPLRIVVMGVSGSGKTTLGRLLAAKLDARFFEADEFHAPESIAKMSAGIALTDEDRWPWLERLARAVGAEPGPAVVACSSLKRTYRDLLRRRLGDVRFVHPHGDPAVILARMRARTDHYMPPELLKSQIATLEDPAGEPLVFPVPITGDPERIVDKLLADPHFAAGNGTEIAPPAPMRKK